MITFFTFFVHLLIWTEPAGASALAADLAVGRVARRARKLSIRAMPVAAGRTCARNAGREQMHRV